MPREGVLGQATRIDPVPADHEALDSLRAREDLGGGELVLRTADGTEISLPSSLLRLVVSAANNLAAGRAVMAIPAEVMLTPTEAAELLGLSRPFVARLLDRGDIPSELLPGSRHRRPSGCLLAFAVGLREDRERDVWLVSGHDPDGRLTEGLDGVLAAGGCGPVAEVRAP